MLLNLLLGDRRYSVEVFSKAQIRWRDASSDELASVVRTRVKSMREYGFEQAPLLIEQSLGGPILALLELGKVAQASTSILYRPKWIENAADQYRGKIDGARSL